LDDSNIDNVIKSLRKAYKSLNPPIVTEVSKDKNPFKVLISTIISLRTKDNVTRFSSNRLFELADNPFDMLNLDIEIIEEAIYPAGFYKTKARNIKKICEIIIKKHKGMVPDSIEELLVLPGVGRKTANLVVTLGYRKPGICVDTHVHRISNRLGYISTKTPEQTEFTLRKKLPNRYWIEYNDLLVTYGQNICKPVSPFCSKCVIYSYCDRRGIVKSR